MTFANNTFILLFFPALLAVSALAGIFLPGKPTIRNLAALAFSLVFYAWAGPGAFCLLLGMAAGCWGCCRWLTRTKKGLAIGVTLLALPLVLFKYTGFLAENLNRLTAGGLSVPRWALPLGISFYTFQAISLVVDVFREQGEKPTLFQTVFYLTFFPTVVSGPITRYQTVRSQMEVWHLTPVQWSQGVTRVAVGLGQKLLVADKLAPLADTYFGLMAQGYEASVWGLWLGSFAYTLQIYFDFQGYTNIALGTAQLLGFQLPQNFNAPYRAVSIQGFWRRWHITLSQWFRDYVYIPLGGNRVPPRRHILNLLAVWLLTGIWHGANWTFVVWGLGYFLLLTAEKYFPEKLKFFNQGLPGHLYTLFWVNLLWVVFRADSLTAAGRYLAGMAGVGSHWQLEPLTIRYLPLLLLGAALCLPWERWLAKAADRPLVQLAKGLALALAAILAVASLTATSYTPFIYGKF